MLSGIANLSAQKQLDFKISNDKFVLQDKYYTSGFHITYRKNIENDFIFKQKDDQKLQVNILLGNETYTPSNLFSFNTADFDRPYAGWFFTSIELAKLNAKTGLFLKFETGVTGRVSLAGNIQTAFHKLLNIEVPTWHKEIENKVLFNLKLNHANNFLISKNLSLLNNFGISIGTKDTFVQNNVSLFFGNFNKLQNSYRLEAVPSFAKNEFYAFVRGGYRYVLLNTLIQGSAFNRNDPFTSIAKNQVFKLASGGVLRTNKNVFKLEFNYNSRETPTSKSHIFGTFTFGFIW